ncbi:IPT/TIG domain-containing protein [Paenibacillus sp. UMB4589-SE434]|uniref:IPT/TIG domain-containing protein n=1 Tax=Paenibacillus sp. UMB4589-SE434 TaxID=3046314 RepID=UPI00254BE05D|nr:IPT/TIG domain-containing protein [Paenibacillus sp. UMB4589-SE434]MDK8181639.1 IPT/TIG domain-containing protein [Paenibacillus sp. UMB4589-SE434]
MRKFSTKLLNVLFAFLLVVTQLPGLVQASQSTEVVQVSKSINPTSILEGEETEVKLSIQGSNPVNFVKPNDIVLIIDRSGSMNPNQNGGEDKIGHAKSSAKGFIDLIDFNKHRVAIVDFSSDVRAKDFSSNPSDLKGYVDGLQASGSTATASSITKARDLLKNHRPDAQPVIVLMTDGEATIPSPEATARQKALEEASAAKGESIVFYTIALLKKDENPGTSAPNVLLKDMATTALHHHFVLGSVGLAEIYNAIVKEIGLASAYNVTLEDSVSPEFEIVPDSYKDNIPQPVVTGNKLKWKFNELKAETLTFTYKIRHKQGSPVGDLSVGANDIYVGYKDYLGEQHEFLAPHPKVKVSYPAPVITSIQEDNGLIQGGETVVIKGKNFQAASTVTFGTNKVNTVQFVDSSKLSVVAPAGQQGSVDVKVTNVDGQFAVAPYQYKANPVITSITPNKGPLSGGSEVVIKGDFFLAGAQVKFGENLASINSIKPQEIVLTVPSSTNVGTVSVKVINPDHTSAIAAEGYTYILGPTLVSLSPNKGLTLGGETVTLTGERFLEGAKVYFNNEAINATFVSDTALTIVTPKWAKAESVAVKIVNPDGQTSELKNGYAYVLPKPEITSVEPTEGPVSGGTIVKVTGSHFVTGAKVYLNNTLVSATTIINDKEIQFRTPSWSKGESVDIRVVNPDGQDATLKGAFTFILPLSPEISSITPTNGPLAGGTSITIKGANLTAGTKLYVGQKEVVIASLTKDQIVANTPKWDNPSKVNIKIVDSFGRESVLIDAFEYLAPPPPPAPKLESVSPASGPQAGGNVVNIVGKELASGLKLYFNDTEVKTFSYMSKESISIKMPAWPIPGKVSIKIVNPDGQQASLTDAYTYIPLPKPEVTSLTPNKGVLAGGAAVSINGTNFVNGAKVQLGGKELQTTFISATQLKIVTPVWAQAEKVDVTVVNPDGQKGVLAQGYEFETPPPPPAPTVISITPNSGPQSGGNIVSIKGTNFTQGSKVRFGQMEVMATVMNASEISVRVPAWTKGEIVSVSVVNPDNQVGMLADAYTFIAPPPPPGPEVLNTTPNEGETTGGYVISIIGKNFKSDSKVYFNDTLVSATFYSATEFKLRTPKWATNEEVDVKVVNSDGQENVLAKGFKYILPPPPPAPVVNAVTPNEVVLSGGTNITINGENFVNGAKVRLGTMELAATFMSNKQLAVKVPVWSKAEAVDVIVVNPDGQIGLLAGGLKYILPPPPSIDSITPNTGLNSGGTVVIIKGKNFNATTKVYINNVEAPSSYFNPTEVQAKIPASSAVGAVDVKVINSDGQFGAVAGGFTYTAQPPKPGPVINSVTPNNGAKTGGNVISVLGANFVNGSVVYINGVLSASSFYGSGQMVLRVPGSAITGPVDVKVINPDGQEALLPGAYTYN